MGVPFSQIPADLNLPLFFAELDNSQANGATVAQRGLVVGQMTSTGTAVPGVPVIVQGSPTYGAPSVFGKGSQISQMVDFFRQRDSFGELWALPLLDNVASVVATGTITITAVAAAAGTLNAYIGGRLIQAAVSTTMTLPQIATALAAAINADANCAVTAAAVAAVVTLSARNLGADGNDIDVQFNYYGGAGGESFPAGLTVAIAPMSGGTAAPVLDAALAALGDVNYDFVAFAYTDAVSLASIKSYMGARWSWDKMLYGGVFVARRGTVGDLTTFGTTQNDPHLSVMGFNGSPNTAWQWAANYAGSAAVALRDDPGRPLQTLPLDVLAPPQALRFVAEDRNVLTHDGISTFTVDPANGVHLETCVTTYQYDDYGNADNSYMYVERLYTLAAVIRDLRTFVESKFARVKLADDGTNFAPGSAIVTPKVLKAAIIGRYRQLEYQGLVQDSDIFAAALVVTRNASNRCRVDGILPIIPIDQLRQFAALIQFRNSTGI